MGETRLNNIGKDRGYVFEVNNEGIYVIAPDDSVFESIVENIIRSLHWCSPNNAPLCC